MPRPLELSLLGSPRVTRGGVALALDTRKAVALLAYLALSGAVQGRDTLAGLLWPDYPQIRARAALRRTLSVINRAGDPALEIARDAVGLSGQRSQVDVLEFGELLSPCLHETTGGGGCAACLPTLERAVGLYRGDFMAGFSLRDSAVFDEWQAVQSDELRQRLAVGLDRLSAARAAAGRPEAALTAARRWLGLDALHEPAHRRLMELYASTGQRSAALTQYRTCVRVLDVELGVPPLSETTALYHRIREHAPAVRGVPPVPARTRPAERAPAHELVGRGAQLATVLAECRAAKPDGRLLALTGEPGIGKTRLAAEVVAAARAAGSAVLVTRGHEEESGLPYGVVVSALRAAVTADPRAAAELPRAWRTELGQLLPDLLPDAGERVLSGGVAAQTRLYDAVTGLLTAVLAGSPPGLLVIDDAHWVDDASLAVLAYLARRLSGRPLAVLLTWRPGESPTVPRLSALLSGAVREGAGTRVDLGRLTREDVRLLCGDAVGDVAARLYEESEGLPLLVVEYLRALTLDAGASSSAWQLPRSAADLLRARVLAVSEPAQQVLTAASVVGLEFRLDVVRHACGRGEHETAAALQELVDCGLLHELDEPAGSYGFTHDKLREVACAAAGAGRRRRLHRRVAEALLAGGEDQDALIGTHLRAAGDDQAAARAFATAALRAFAVHAHAEAEAHAAAALALGPPQPAVLHELWGDVATARGRYAEAAAAYELAAARRSGAALSAVEHKLGELHARTGDHELADSHLRAALELLGPDSAPELRCAVLASRSLTAHRRGQVERAVGYAQQALVHARGPLPLARVHNLLGLLANSAGDAGTGAGHLEQALALARGAAGQELQVAALNNLASSRAAQGRSDDAVALLGRALVLCRELGDRHREGALHSRLADLLQHGGRSDQARAHILSSVELLADVGDRGVLQPGIWMLEAW